MNEPTPVSNEESLPNLDTTVTQEESAKRESPDAEVKPALTEQAVMAVLAYVGPLVFVPLFTKRDNEAVMFHVRQGLVLFAIGAFLWVISRWFMLGFLWPVISLLNFALLILSIIGISNVLRNKPVPLPLVGKFSQYFTF